MNLIEARDEYTAAVRLGQKEVSSAQSKGLPEAPRVLDAIANIDRLNVLDIGLVEIPAERIVGTKTAGRTSAFSPSFRPLLPPNTEFAAKWIKLCAAHLSDEGIRDPIVCYEYLGNFYVQEGNKRVSVLRHFGAARIPGFVYRVMPENAPESYREFLEFYRGSEIYDIQFRSPGDYQTLLSHLGKEMGQSWDDRERRVFRACFQYFRDAFEKSPVPDMTPEEGLLLWLRVYPFQDLRRLSSMEIGQAWEALSNSRQEPVLLETQPNKPNLLRSLLSFGTDHLNVAFVHPSTPEKSPWVTSHEKGVSHLRSVFGDKVTTKSYWNASVQNAPEILSQAVAEGAQVIFTTAPQLNRAAVKAAALYPKVHFFNCSVDAPYANVRAYYGRVFEGKFITGAIAGAMSENDNIGYIGSYPIFGVPTGINAFALGAQLTNPRAKIHLRWSCLPGNPVEDFLRDDIRVISNKDVPTPDRTRLEHGGYGTYLIGEDGSAQSLGSPCWMWGKYYERVVGGLLEGTWEQDSHRAINDWWGMSSGVIDVTLSRSLPEGLRLLADMLRKGLQEGTVDPFRRRLVTQDGTVINDGSRSLTTQELLHMSWLCENVEGSIPEFDQLLPISQPTVRELGIYRDRIPVEKEGSL